MTIPALLDRCMAQGSGRPLLTFYDHALGEQTELSVATTANWVNKTANMLVDGIGAYAGQTVRVHLPAHWAAAVWLLGAWSAGLVVALDDEPTDIAVIGPDDLDDAGLTGADEVLAVSLTTLGTRFTHPLPAGVWDYHGEVLGFGDHFSPTVRDSDPAVRTPGGIMSHQQLIQTATEADWPTATRLLTDAGSADGLGTELVGMLTVNGSLVIVRNPDPAKLPGLTAGEKVTARSLR